MLRAVWNGKVIAEAAETIEIEGNQYFPADSIRPEFFSDSPTTTVCSWKGLANYKTVTVDGSVNRDAAWYYRDPKPEAREIKDYFAFWHGVKVERDTAGSTDAG